MFATTHILASIVISQRLSSQWWAFLVSLFSHYLFDLIPHGDAPLGSWMTADPKKRRMIYVLSSDGLCSVVFLVFFWLHGNLPGLSTLIPAMVGGVLPDFIWFINYVLKERGLSEANYPHVTAFLNKINAFHHAVHIFIDHKIKKIWPGIVIQLAFFFIFIYFIGGWR
jgi:hypothetical protein